MSNKIKVETIAKAPGTYKVEDLGLEVGLVINANPVEVRLILTHAAVVALAELLLARAADVKERWEREFGPALGEEKTDG